MPTTFQDELQQFLITYGISIETPIFKDFLKKAIGISIEDSKYFGIDLGTKIKNDKKTFVDFHVPAMSIGDFEKVLKYFELSLNDVMINQPLKISQKFICEKVLPQFIAYIIEQSKQDSPDYVPYVVKSKAKLESMSIAQINNALTQLLAKINKIENVSNMHKRDIKLSKILFAIQGPLREVKDDEPQYYAYLLRAVEELDSFFKKHSKTRNSKALKSDIDLLYDGLKNYETYCRAESSIAAINFKNNINVFLQNFQISSAYCDIVEETLLEMAGITSRPSDCKYNTGNDKARLVFKITGITAEEAKQFVEFFKTNGDKTAQMGNGDKVYTTYVPEHALSESEFRAMIPMPQAYVHRGDRHSKDPITYSIEVDAKAFVDNILPQFKVRIEALPTTAPQVLQGYKDKCCVPMMIQGFNEVYEIWHKMQSEDDMVLVLSELISELSALPRDQKTPNDNVLTMMRAYKVKLGEIILAAGVNFTEETTGFWPNNVCRDKFCSSFSLLIDYCGKTVSSLKLSPLELASSSSHVSVDNNDSSPSSPSKYSYFQPDDSSMSHVKKELSQSF